MSDLEQDELLEVPLPHRPQQHHFLAAAQALVLAEVNRRHSEALTEVMKPSGTRLAIIASTTRSAAARMASLITWVSSPAHPGIGLVTTVSSAPSNNSPIATSSKPTHMVIVT